MASRFEGGSIVGIDLSQIELRVSALVSGEPSIRNAYINGEDLHATRARSLWPDYDQVPEEKKRRRQVGKMMNFADLFLSSANTMREQVYAQSNGDIDLPIDVFKEVVNTRNKIRPVLTAWQKEMIWTAKARHRIELPLTGQSRYFSDIAKERSEIVNFPIQTTASNLMMQIQFHLQTELNRQFPTYISERPRLFLQVFDAVYIDTPPKMGGMMRDIFKIAIEKVCSPSGYWGLLTKHYDSPLIPLEFDVEVLATRSPSEPPHEQSIQARSCHEGAA
jgi:DNA polymerase-1